jgi:hypothetical protein
MTKKKDEDDRSFSISLVPLNEDLDDEEKEVLRQELESISEQDVLDYIADSKEEMDHLVQLKQKQQKRDSVVDDNEDKDNPHSTSTEDKDDNSTEILLEEEIRERGIQLKTELSFSEQELVEEAIKHNLSVKEIVRRKQKHSIDHLNENHRHSILIYIFARHDLLEDPKYTPEEGDLEFVKDLERDIIKRRKEITKMEDRLRRLDDS